MPRKPQAVPQAVREFEYTLGDIHHERTVPPEGCDQRVGFGFCPQQMPDPPDHGRTCCYYHRKIRAGLLRPVIRPYTNTKNNAA